MRLTVSAARTHAGADRTAGKGTAHATSTLPSLALATALSHATALASSAPHTTASFSVHFMFLLVCADHCPTTALTPSITARHGKSIAIQSIAEPSLNNFLQIAGDKWNDMNPVRAD